MRMTIEVLPGRGPISGWLQEGSAPVREFEGMLELIALLERVRERASTDGASGIEDEAGDG